jgi:hypothetical protein
VNKIVTMVEGRRKQYCQAPHHNRPDITGFIDYVSNASPPKYICISIAIDGVFDDGAKAFVKTG